MNIAQNSYTLNDKVFRYGLLQGSDSENFFDDNRKILIIGGAACQLHLIDKPECFRATTDVDFLTNRPIGKENRRRWATGLVERISQEGEYSVTGGLSRYGSEVRFGELKPDFILHLDCYGKGFMDRHKKRIDTEFERAETEMIKGKVIRYVSKLDIILNKIRRLNFLESSEFVGLDSAQREFLSHLYEGQFDDALSVLNSSNCNLESVLAKRNQTVEDLGRLGHKEVMREVQGYKATKDIYDIISLLDSAQRNHEEIPLSEFKSGLREVLIE